MALVGTVERHMKVPHQDWVMLAKSENLVSYVSVWSYFGLECCCSCVVQEMDRRQGFVCDFFYWTNLSNFVASSYR